LVKAEWRGFTSFELRVEAMTKQLYVEQSKTHGEAVWTIARIQVMGV
jgi:hypothetical protein